MDDVIDFPGPRDPEAPKYGGLNPPPPSPGRPKGIPNKTTTLLKDAILLAAAEVGQDGRGTDGLIGYLKARAQDEPKAFMGLLGRVLPYNVIASGADGMRVLKTRVEIVQALAEREIPLQALFPDEPPRRPLSPFDPERPADPVIPEDENGNS